MHATLNVRCEKCLKHFLYEINGCFELTVINEDNEQQTNTEVVVLSENGTVSLKDIVEDEVLLGLPVVIKHPEGTCETLNS